MAEVNQRWEVHTIIQRPDQNGGEGKAYWMRVGSAFNNKDGSINVFLDAFPVNGKLQLRIPMPKEDQQQQGAPQASQRPAPAQQPPQRNGNGGNNRGGQW